MPTIARNREILARRATGETLDSIGARYGLTRQRVHQIINLTHADLLARRNQLDQTIKTVEWLRLTTRRATPWLA